MADKVAQPERAVARSQTGARLDRVCRQCSKPFTKLVCLMVRENSGTYCSVPCQRLGTRARQPVPCARCGTMLERKLSRMAKVKQHYCNMTCRTAGGLDVKTCIKCGEAKQLSDFAVRSSKPAMFYHQCKICLAVGKRAWNIENAESVRAKSAARHQANRDHNLAMMLARRLADPEKCAKERQIYYFRNADTIRAKGMAYRKANPNPAADLARRQKRLARLRGVEYERITLADVIRRDGLDCYICGVTTDPTLLPHSPTKAELEHVVALSQGGPHTALNLRVACYRCNRLKGAKRTPDEVRLILESWAA